MSYLIVQQHLDVLPLAHIGDLLTRFFGNFCCVLNLVKRFCLVRKCVVLAVNMQFTGKVAVRMPLKINLRTSQE